MKTELFSLSGIGGIFRHKTLAAAIGLSLYGGQANALEWTFSGTMTHYDSAGNPSGTFDSTVVGVFDFTAGTGAFNSSSPFEPVWRTDGDAMFLYDTSAGGTQNFNWAWTNKQIFTGSAVINCRTGSGSLDGCAGITGTTLTATTNSYSFSLSSSSQFGLGLFLDWSINQDIPLLAVMQRQDDLSDGVFGAICVDTDGDGVPCTAMKTLPFPGYTLDFQGTFTGVTAAPVPAAAWLFGSGLLGLLGVARRKRA